MSPILKHAAALLAAFLVFAPEPAAAQSSSRGGKAAPGASDIQLPADPRLWFNSSPLTMESLEGKGVVFLFFEEECPKCAASWPEAQKLAQQYDGKPIVFVGVNSGTDPRALKRYLGQHRVGMPVISDPTREFENAMGVPELSLDGEVVAVRYVSGQGARGELPGNDLAGAAEQALKGASWRVDPSAVPPSLRPAWKAIELGDYAAAARPLNRALESRDDAVKAGAKELMAAVEEELNSAVKDATTALAENDDWSAFKHLKAINDRFGDYEIDLIEKADSKAKELSKTDAVRHELAAGKLLEKALTKRSPRDLERVAKRYPATEAGGRASELLAKLPQ